MMKRKVQTTFFSFKKGVISLTTFVFLLLLLLALFAVSYGYYVNYKEDSMILNTKINNMNALLSFRSELISLASYPNSTLNYSDSYIDDGVEFTIKNGKIMASKTLSFDIVNVNVSALGLNFSSDYTFYPTVGGFFTSSNGVISFVSN